MTADFEELIRQNSGRIRRIAIRYADTGEVEDLTQEILVETWVYRAALNTALTGARKSISSRRFSPGPAPDTLQRAGDRPGSGNAQDVMSSMRRRFSL